MKEIEVRELIEVGEYVRTKEGYIFKVKEINEDYLVEDKEYGGMGCFIEYALKHSFNIIDLIEEFDYVNGYCVRKILNYNNELCIFDLNVMDWIQLTEIDVFYNIVTKEQFKSVEYEVN